MLPALNQHVGKIRIISHIASGAIASVYKGFHEELEVIRAVKILKPGFTEETKNRFKTEAKIWAKLHHPNIVQIYNVGTWQDIVPFIELEYIEGHSLLDYISKGQSPSDAFVLSMGISICKALQHAQEQTYTVYGKKYKGMVHRDIKPANILIDKKGKVKLTDFGIALPGNVSLHTIGPYTMGTYAYLSPEQLKGVVLDTRSDIYSLGVMLYEMTAGIKPFPQKHVAQLVKEKLGGRYSSLSSVCSTCSKQLSNAIDKCLDVDRTKRFASPAECLKKFNDILLRTTDKTTTEIINSYRIQLFENQETKTLAGTAAGKRSKTFQITMLSTVIVLFLILSAISFFIIRNAMPNKEEKAVQAEIISKPDIDNGLSTGDINDTSEKEIKPESILNTIKKNNTRKIPDENTGFLKPPSNTIHKADNSSVYSLGVSLFKEKKYGKAQQCFETLLEKRTGNRQKVIIYLIESSLLSGNRDRALEVAEKFNVNDGKYFLLKGKLYYEQGLYKKAQPVIYNAQTTPSVFGEEIQCDAIYLWALNCESLYRKKPNVTNKNMAIKAWKNFKIRCCGKKSSGSLCRKASNSITSLNKKL